MDRIDRIEEMMEQLIASQKKTDAQLAETNVQLAKTDAQLAETNVQLAKTDVQLAKTDAQLAKTDAQLAKTDAQLAKTDAQLARTDAQFARTDAQFVRTDAQLALTDAQLAKTDLKLKATRDMLHSIGINLGDIAEEFFYNALSENKKLGPIKFDEISMNMKNKIKHVEDEFDIVLFNGKSVGLVEIKHKVHANDLIKLYTSKLENFRFLFPTYKHHKIYLGIGGFSVTKSVLEEAKKRGIAVLLQKAEVAINESEYMQAY